MAVNRPNLLAAFGLMLVFEGVLPFAAPRAWREAFRKATALSDFQVRFLGLASMGAGLLFFSLLK
ncbi:MAG: DUF2065 domain-containing protein [Betaproteobacteria bacterium]|nr:DUF2065 domain-containing protein [Betaproteobacteria bacterium]